MARLTNQDLAWIISNNPDLGISRLESSLRASKPIPRPQAVQCPGPQIRLKEPISDNLPPLSFTVCGPPCSKPRQTKSDKWKKRPSVLKYRAWADEARKAANAAVGRRFPGLVLRSYARMKVVAYFPIPPSWTRVLKERMKGQPHQQTSDADNILKAVSDSLFPKYDAQIYHMEVDKFWDDGAGARVEVTLS